MIEIALLFGLMLLFGGASFHFLLWTSAADPDRHALKQRILPRTATVMAAGLLLASAAGIASLSDPLFGVEQLVLALLFFAGHYFAARRNNKILHALALLAGLGVIVMQALASHAAAESGLLPISSSVLHWLIAIGWGGTVLHLALQPWPKLVGIDEQHHDQIAAITETYASASLGALILLALSGGLLGFVHVHNADALHTSVYGEAYTAKVLLALVFLVTVSLHKLAIAGACRAAESTQSLSRAVKRFRRTLGVEAIAVAAIVLATGMLATLTPPGAPPFLNPQKWNVTVGDVPLVVDLQPVAGQVSRARLEISALTPDYRFPEGTAATFSMHRVDGEAGSYAVEALPIGPAAFLGETVLAMPGEWQLDLTLDYPDRGPVSTTYTVSLPAPPLQEDMRAYLNTSTITYSLANVITFCVGLLLILIAVWSLWLCVRQRAPGWLMPFALVNVVMGGFLLISVMFVKTYPSSFWPNPQPFTFEVVQQGESLYREHCAACHGTTGTGDGPWAIAEKGSIPSLTTPHMDTHTDGELFWWNKYGIPSLDMPALGNDLSDDENWIVINFVRSLRHDIPPPP